MYNGYWERDSSGNYHWVPYGSAGFILIIIAAFVENVAVWIYNFLSSNLTVAAIAAVETAIVFAIFKKKKPFLYILNFIQTVTALLTLKLAAAALIPADNLQFEEAVGAMFEQVFGGFIYGLILMVVYGLGFSKVWLGIGDDNTKEVIKGLIYQLIGLGIFIFFRYMSLANG